MPDGPVLLAELAQPELADILVFGSVGFLVGDIAADIRPSIIRARVFAGYSGWGPGQLEAEMAVDSWIVEPALGDLLPRASRVVRGYSDLHDAMLRAAEGSR